jgi:hypothetical protein
MDGVESAPHIGHAFSGKNRKMTIAPSSPVNLGRIGSQASIGSIAQAASIASLSRGKMRRNSVGTP